MKDAVIFRLQEKKNSFFRQLFRWKFLFVFSLILTYSLGATPPPSLEEGLPLFEAEHEKRLGAAMMRQLRQTEPISQDLLYNEYVRTLGKRLVAVAPKTPFPFHFFVLETPIVNAFAFFGGHIGVDTGLLKTIDSESELAAVLAHEIAHISQQHLSRMLKANQQLLPITMAQLLGALVLGSIGDPSAGAHAATAVMAGHTQTLINYTRTHEQEADRIGIQILAKAGFDPEAMPTLFHHLNAATRHQDKPSPYLLTHPLYESRIADAYHRAGQFSYHQAPNSALFDWIKVRLEVRSSKQLHELERRFAKRLSQTKPPQQYISEYGYALTLIEEHQYEKAYPVLKNLCAKLSNHWIPALELALLEKTLGKIEAALSRLKALTQLHPENRAIVFQYADVLLIAKEAKAAKELLHSKMHWAFDDPILYSLLSKSYYLLNKKTEMHHMQAEWNFANGDYKGALQQLDIAMKSASPVQTESLQERRLEIERLWRNERSML